MFYGVASNTLSGSTFGVSNGMANPALSFATVTDIRDTNIRVQPQVLLNNMNGWGLVDKNKALYPFVSDGYIESRATQHKYNLMNPADTDAAFRLTFGGGITHSSTGALPNGTTGFANSHINPNSNLGNTFAAHYYSRTNNSNIGFEIGCITTAATNPRIQLECREAGSAYISAHSAEFGVVTADSTKLYGINRSSSTQINLYKNGSSIYSNGAATLTDRPNADLYMIGVSLNNAFYRSSFRECAWSDVFNGVLSATDETNLNNIVVAFQTSLSRNV